MRKLAVAILIPLIASCSLPGLKREEGRPRVSPPVEESKKPSPKERGEGYYQIGVAYLEMGELPLALNYLFKAKELLPKEPKVYNAIGLAFLKRGELSQAEKNLRKAISLKPNFSEAWLNLGILYEEKGELSKARSSYLKALENPLYLTPEVAYYRLALLELKVGNPEQAKKYLVMAIKNNPDYAPAYVELAKLLTQEGKRENAKEIYFRLINIYPNLQYPYCALGELFYSEGELRLASKYLKKCISINPNTLEAARARRRIEEIER